MSKKSINQLFNLKGKVAIVTGGTMGMGYGITKRFIEAGGRVVMADIAEEAGVKKAKALGPRCWFIKTDVSAEKEVKRLVVWVRKKFGRLDILINNAGIFPSAPVLNMELALWEKIQAVNLRGVFLCSRAAAEIMVKK